MKRSLKIIILLLLGLFASPGLSLAFSNSSTFTITPPLVKINMNPAEEFVSAIKVVNNNDRTIVVQAQTANFKNVDNGRVEFAEDGEIEGDYTLKSWINLPQKSFEIRPFSSKNIPYIIKTPEDASPGGHYAGILIGTPSADSVEEGAVVGISQLVASLIFVNISGDILEKGYIRQFSTDKNFYNGDSVEFEVRFENTGNVHLKPVGDIKIYNFFGKEKGYIPINHKTDFGNVLPESERRWRFSWTAKNDFILANRYRAVLTLSFGEEAKQADQQEFFFWLVNVKLLIIVVGSIVGFLVLLFLFIRVYIRQSVKNVQKMIEQESRKQSPNYERPNARRDEKKIVDLRNKPRR